MTSSQQYFWKGGYRNLQNQLCIEKTMGSKISHIK